jgi:hypothetical protein
MRQSKLWLWAIVMAVSGPFVEASAAAADLIVRPGQSIQAAIDGAPEGATIVIAAGTYNEGIAITKPLTLQGAGWEKTAIGPVKTMPLTPKQKDEFFAALEATQDPQERAKIAVAFANRPPAPIISVSNAKGVVLRGIKFRGAPAGDGESISAATVLTFENAGGAVSECAVLGPHDHGIRILRGSDVTIDKTLVAALWGTGVDARAGTKLRMRECDVRNCYHRGITLGTDDATIEQCRISGSAWHGIRYDDCSPRIVSNQIFGNARSGIYASGRTSATVRGNVIWRNEMNAMSCWFYNADEVEGNTIIGNLREGIAVIGDSRTNLVRNVFVDNPIGVSCSRAASFGQPMAESPSGGPKLVENFFYRNPKAFQEGTAAKPLPLDNRSADPKVGGKADDFRLAADSPARLANAGAIDPAALASAFAIQPEETSMIPESETRDSSKWKEVAAARR